MELYLRYNQKRVEEIFKILKHDYGLVHTFLDHKSPFQLLIAVILSAQCTDERVNKESPKLFKLYPTAKELSEARIEDVKGCIKSINFFNNKSINIVKTAKLIHYQFQDRVPEDLEQLIKLPGVGKKTANVILGQIYGKPAITVDTHVNRLSSRLGFSKEKDANKKEKILQRKWPKDLWTDLSSLLIIHGRKVCTARKPNCSDCKLNHLCKFIDNKDK